MTTKSKSSLITAALILIGLIAWMASGYIGRAAESDPMAEESATVTETDAAEAEPVKRMRVVAEPSEAQWIENTHQLPARTAALQMVDVSSQISGRIIKVNVQTGTMVSKGDVLFELSLAVKPSMLKEAEAWVLKNKADVAAGDKLRDQGYISEAEHIALIANLRSAERQLAEIQLSIKLTKIIAPFDGVVEKRWGEVGAVIAVGERLARLVRQDQYLVVSDVSEKVVAELKPGSEGYAILHNGRRVDGAIRFISTQADDVTKTYRVELLIHNAQPTFTGGAAAQLFIHGDRVKGHSVSTNLITLNAAGDMGIKTLNEQGLVEFWPVDIGRVEQNSVLVSGLPDHTRIIVSGQGFVRSGSVVDTE